MSKQNERLFAQIKKQSLLGLATTDDDIISCAATDVKFAEGANWALTDLKRELGLDESADLEAVVKEVVALARELSQQFFSYNGHEGHCAIDDEPLEGFEPYPCTCRAKALAPFKKG